MGIDLSGERRILGEGIVHMDSNCDEKMLLRLIRAGNYCVAKLFKL